MMDRPRPTHQQEQTAHSLAPILIRLIHCSVSGCLHDHIDGMYCSSVSGSVGALPSDWIFGQSGSRVICY